MSPTSRASRYNGQKLSRKGEARRSPPDRDELPPASPPTGTYRAPDSALAMTACSAATCPSKASRRTSLSQTRTRRLLFVSGRSIMTCGIRPPELIAYKCELHPIGRGQDGDDGQPGARMNEFVEMVDCHRALTCRSACRCTEGIRSGPPVRTSAATTTLA